MSDLLPPSSTATERALAEALGRLSDIPVPIADVWNADTIPLPLLPWLAWAYSVDEWGSNWSEAQKRATVKTALEVQRRKGTIGAVRDALRALGLEVTVQEWYRQEPAGTPYTFRIYIEAGRQEISREGYSLVEEVIAAAKNLRSHYSEISLRVRVESAPFVGAVILMGNDIVMPNYITAEDVEFMGMEARLDQAVNTDWPAALAGL